MKKLFFMLLTISVAVIVNAQCNLGEPVKIQLVKDWELAKGLANDIMPADKYSFKACVSNWQNLGHLRCKSFYCFIKFNKSVMSLPMPSGIVFNSSAWVPKRLSQNVGYPNYFEPDASQPANAT